MRLFEQDTKKLAVEKRPVQVPDTAAMRTFTHKTRHPCHLNRQDLPSFRYPSSC
jgi:hypothetical protein